MRTVALFTSCQSAVITDHATRQQRLGAAHLRAADHSWSWRGASRWAAGWRVGTCSCQRPRLQTGWDLLQQRPGG